MSNTTSRPDDAKHNSTDPELDRVFDALSHRHRRRILLAIDEANPRDEDEFAPEDLQAETEELDLFMTQHVHVHLPKLEEAGYIEWDRKTNAITRGENYDEIAPLIRLMRDHKDELPTDWF